MAFMVIIEWEGLTPEQYDRLREAVGWLEGRRWAGVATSSRSVTEVCE